MSEDQVAGMERNAVDEALAKISANSLRVVAQAGRPYDIVQDMTHCLHSFHEYSDKVGHEPFELPQTLGGSREMRRREEADPLEVGLRRLSGAFANPRCA
jgi:hypothetical protein